MVEKCAQCGIENAEGSLYCQKCGAQLITKNVIFQQKVKAIVLKKTFWTIVIFVGLVLLLVVPWHDTSQSNSSQITATPDPDPIVECQFTNLPWQKMKSSQCATSHECQVGNKWNIYKSQEECTKAQLQQAPSDPNPIVSCQFKNLPVQEMRESECKGAIECQVGDKWYVYSSQSQCSQYQSLQASNDWSKYRAARINDLKAMLKATQDTESKANAEIAKYTKMLNDLTDEYKQGKVSSEYYKGALDKHNVLLNAYKEYFSYIDSNKRAISSLITRYQNGENIMPEEEKAILGY